MTSPQNRTMGRIIKVVRALSCIRALLGVEVMTAEYKELLSNKLIEFEVANKVGGSSNSNNNICDSQYRDQSNKNDLTRSESR
jgi:hypothetical protein